MDSRCPLGSFLPVSELSFSYPISLLSEVLIGVQVDSRTQGDLSLYDKLTFSVFRYIFSILKK